MKIMIKLSFVILFCSHFVCFSAAPEEDVVTYKTKISLVWVAPGHDGLDELTPWLWGVGGAAIHGTSGLVAGGIAGGLGGAIGGALSTLEKDSVVFCIGFLSDRLRQLRGGEDPMVVRVVENLNKVLAVVNALPVEKIDPLAEQIARGAIGVGVGAYVAYTAGDLISWLGDGPWISTIRDAAAYGGAIGGGIGAAIGKLEAETGLVTKALSAAFPPLAPAMAAIDAIGVKTYKAAALGAITGAVSGAIVGGGVGVYEGYNKWSKWASDVNLDMEDSTNAIDFGLLIRRIRVEDGDMEEEVSSIKVMFKPFSSHGYDSARGKYFVDVMGVDVPEVDSGSMRIRHVDVLEDAAPYFTVEYPDFHLDFQGIVNAVSHLDCRIYKYRDQRPGTGNGVTICRQILRNIPIRFPLPDFSPTDLLLPPLGLVHLFVNPLAQTYERIRALPLAEKMPFIEAAEKYYVELGHANFDGAGAIVGNLRDLKREIMVGPVRQFLRDNLHSGIGRLGSHFWIAPALI